MWNGFLSVCIKHIHSSTSTFISICIANDALFRISLSSAFNLQSKDQEDLIIKFSSILQHNISASTKHAQLTLESHNKVQQYIPSNAIKNGTSHSENLIRRRNHRNINKICNRAARRSERNTIIPRLHQLR